MRKQNDLGAAGGLIFLFILGAGIWVGYTIAKLYFDHKTIENEIGAIGEDALLSKRVDSKDRVSQLLDGYFAQYDKEKIVSEVNAQGDRITISVPYDRVAHLMVTDMPFHFEVNVQRQARKAVGMLNAIQDSLDSSANNSAQKYQKALQGSGSSPPPSE